MERENTEEMLQAYAAGELSEEEAARFEEELARSARLREELERYERLFVVLAAAAEEEVRVPRTLHARALWHAVIAAYLKAASELAAGLLGAYGRALVSYLGLA